MTRSANAPAGPQFLPEIDLTRLYDYSQRKSELEHTLVKAQLELTQATLELSRVNAEYQTLQSEIAARHGLKGVFAVAPDGQIFDYPWKSSTDQCPPSLIAAKAS